MRKIAVVLAVMVLAAGVGEAQDANPRGAVSFVLLGSWAPLGLGGEVFFGDLGVGGTFTALPFSVDAGFVMIYEPGAYARYYLGGPDGSFFVTGGIAYLSALGATTEDVEFVDGKLVKLKGGLGYNALFGKNSDTRFSFEVGPAYRFFVVEDTNADALFPIFPYFAIMFGKTF